MKKRFVRPQIQVEVIEDINEPVYMACSGMSNFSFPAGGWTHQKPETGRWNFAEQTNGQYQGPAISGPVTTYAYVTFDKPVNVVQWFDSFTTLQNPNGDPAGSFTIVGSRYWPNGLNHNEGIGLGALYVVPEDPSVTELTLEKVTMALSYNPNGCG